MALESCAECEKAVSTSAQICPHCGYPLARKRLLSTIKSSAKRAWAGPPHIQKPVPEDAFFVARETAEQVFASMTPAKTPWSLTRINGIGLRVGKRIPIVRINGQLIGAAPLYFTFLFIPILSFGWRVVKENGGGYIFLGKIDPVFCQKLLGRKLM
jgi:hypothetical protein